ncbi:hypothetical protein SteCoe_21082 [Stentor coeruleus]|uniref:F-box domain-containing protein n=1 Tax=Stentor coeruleus TaxID=5963 RepID=A0A1R2BQL6_9CILI|nr:hypothetical protein SteCoe_21082 [Stentor coeruleus]
MEAIIQKMYIMTEIFCYLPYKEIILLRRISKKIKKRIDSISTWEKIVTTSFPSLMFIENISASTSLAVLENISKNKGKIEPQTTFPIGILGYPGKLDVVITEPEHLARAGFIGSMKEYISYRGVCRLCPISIPKVEMIQCQLRLITTFLVVADGEDGWENKIRETISKLEEYQIRKIVVFVRVNSLNSFLKEISEKYPVLFFTELTTKDICRTLKALDSVINNDEIVNIVPPLKILNPPASEKVAEKPKKKKCMIF